jgi:hypothetical protein
MKPTVTKAPSDGATSSKAHLLASAWQRAIACYYHMSDNPDVSTTQHCGQEKPLTKCGLFLNHHHHLAMPQWWTIWKLRTITHDRVRAIYEAAKDPDTPKLTTTLNLQPITEVLKWTKCHLDAYLATAEVYLEQNVDPCKFYKTPWVTTQVVAIMRRCMVWQHYVYINHSSIIIQFFIIYLSLCDWCAPEGGRKSSTHYSSNLTSAWYCTKLKISHVFIYFIN